MFFRNTYIFVTIGAVGDKDFKRDVVFNGCNLYIL